MNERSEFHALVAREAQRRDDFAALCENCGGAWPGTILEMLRTIDTPDARRLMTSSRLRRDRVECDRRLPLSHLLDADWRFTRETAEVVLNALLSASDGDLLLVGMPSVALAAQDHGLASRIVVASRPHDPIDEALRSSLPDARFHDLRTLPIAHFAAAALDPPWYDDVAGPLLATTRRAVISKGKVFVCVPDRFTFPSQAAIFAELVAAPHRLGFAEARESAKLRYATPFFELRTLEATGILNISPAWRTGTMVACEVGSQTDNGVVPLPQASDWSEIRIGKVRLWARERPPALEEITHVHVVGSISRTHPARSTTQVWTSGNTVATGLSTSGAALTSSHISTTERERGRAMLADALQQEIRDIGRAVAFI